MATTVYGDELFVLNDYVSVYNLKTCQLMRTWSLEGIDAKKNKRLFTFSTTISVFDGLVYVCSRGDQVQVFTLNGEWSRDIFTGFQYPTCMTMDSNGSLYMIDEHSAKFKVVLANGERYDCESPGVNPAKIYACGEKLLAINTNGPAKLAVFYK
jgi:hypothetical protein